MAEEQGEKNQTQQQQQQQQSGSGRGDTKRIELWIAIVGGVVTIATALITILPQILPDKPTQIEDIGEQVAVEPSPEPLVLGEDVNEEESNDIQDELTLVLDAGYDLKVSSLRDVDPAGLDTVYTSDALEYRLSTVEIASKDGCYWDIVLDQPHEYDFEYIGASSARVSTIRYESRFHYCDGELVTENTAAGDRYFIRFYLLKSSDGNWLIFDTEVSDIVD